MSDVRAGGHMKPLILIRAKKCSFSASLKLDVTPGSPLTQPAIVLHVAAG